MRREMDKALLLVVCLWVLLHPMDSFVATEGKGLAPKVVKLSQERKAVSSTVVMLQVNGDPRPVFNGCYSRFEKFRWKNTSCNVTPSDVHPMKFQLTLEDPLDQIFFVYFSNTFGFELFPIDLEESNDTFFRGWESYVIVGASSVGGFIVIISFIAAIVSCRRRYIKGRRRKRRQREFQRNQSSAVSSLVMAPNSGCHGRANTMPAAPSQRASSGQPHRDQNHLHCPPSVYQPDPCQPRPCPCGTLKPTRGYINMQGQAKKEDYSEHEDLAEAITSTVERFRNRGIDRWNWANGNNLLDSRRISRSLSHLNAKPARNGPIKHPMMLPSLPHHPRTLNRLQRCLSRSLGNIFQSTEAVVEYDEEEELSYPSNTPKPVKAARRPPTDTHHPVLKHHQPSEHEAAGMLDNVPREQLQWESQEEYVPMALFVRGSSFPSDPVKVPERSPPPTPGVREATDNRIYMNLQEIQGTHGRLTYTKKDEEYDENAYSYVRRP